MTLTPASQAAALALFGGFVGCEAARRDAFVFEAERVRERTTVSGARVAGLEGIVREPLRVSQGWQLETASAWTKFSADAAAALQGWYRCSATSAALRCVRWMPGDRFHVDFTPGPQGRVRVRIEAQPD